VVDTVRRLAKDKDLDPDVVQLKAEIMAGRLLEFTKPSISSTDNLQKKVLLRELVK